VIDSPLQCSNSVAEYEYLKCKERDNEAYKWNHHLLDRAEFLLFWLSVDDDVSSSWFLSW